MRRITPAAALVTLVLPLTACGSADLSSVAEAANRTQDVRSASFRVEFEQIGEAPSAFADRGVVEGAIDFEARRIRTVLVDGRAGAGESIQDNGVTYLRLPGLEEHFDGKPWVKLDPDRIRSSPDGLTAETVADLNFSMYDPGLWLAFLRDSDRLDWVGEESVGGLEATRYAGTITAEAFLAGLLEGRTEQFDELTRDTRDAEIAIDVWVGEDGLIRRIAYVTPEVAYTTADRVVPPQRSTLEFFDFGAAVDIELPPEKDVFELGVPD